MHLPDLFDAVYVINLASRTDRRREIERQLSDIGVHVDGERVKLFAAVRPDGPGGFPTIGARGCFLSHLHILQDAQRRGLARLLILEDDADFQLDFMVRLQDMAGTLGAPDWSIFHGGWLATGGGAPGTGPLWRLDPTMSVMGTHMVGLQGAAIGELVDYLQRMLQRPPGDPDGGPMHVDGAYYWYRRSRPERATLIAVPTLAVQRPSRTDVHVLRWFDRLPVIRDLAAVARRLKAARSR